MPLRLYLPSQPSSRDAPITNNQAAPGPSLHGIWRRLIRWPKDEYRSSRVRQARARPVRHFADAGKLTEEYYGGGGAEADLDYTVALAFLLML